MLFAGTLVAGAAKMTMEERESTSRPLPKAPDQVHQNALVVYMIFIHITHNLLCKVLAVYTRTLSL